MLLDLITVIPIYHLSKNSNALKIILPSAIHLLMGAAFHMVRALSMKADFNLFQSLPSQAAVLLAVRQVF